ncbi:MAG: ThuA domain-containing protein [Thermoguttaceae bacterium]|jgi:type 1 glutamine amidotransferase
MCRSKLLSTAVLLAVSLLPACALWAGEAPKPDSAKKLKVLVLVGGHGFEVKPFHEIFHSFSDMKCTIVEEKVGGEAFDNIDHWPYDAMVFYNFEKKPSDKQKQNFLKLLDRGVGLVILHHGLHAYKSWPEYKKIAGITDFVTDAKDGVDYRIHIEDPQHPIVKGMSDYAVKDETYHGNKVDPSVHVILTTDEPTNTKAIAWVHTYRKSRVCYLQSGHGGSIYGQKEFRAVLGNAIRWSAGRLGPSGK